MLQPAIFAFTTFFATSRPVALALAMMPAANQVRGFSKDQRLAVWPPS